MAWWKSPLSSSLRNLLPEDLYDPMPFDELICVICHLLLCDPVECPCRHVFCRHCIQAWVRQDNSCPVCHKHNAGAITPVSPLLQNLVNRFKVKCQNAGCDARVPADCFAYHTISCEFLEVRCPHKACQHRCQRRLLESHVKQCPQLKVTCERECGLVVTQGCLQSHNCVDELKRMLDEAKSEWTLRGILECSIKDLHEQLDEATRLTSPAGQPSPVVQDSTVESSATSIVVLGAGLNNQATRVSEHAVSHFSHNPVLISWPNSFGLTDVEESSLNVP
ncbi:hypothetical protein MRX96_042524 [Rhipicephalus microplus]